MHVSFLFVDVKGSTLLKVDATPEKIKTTFDAYHDYVENFVRRNGGRVVSFAGDGILGQFLNADDAVSAALDIQGNSSEFNQSRNQLFFPFQMRIGITSGEIAESEITGKMTDLLIDAAARIQELCPPGQICLTFGAFSELKRFREYFSYRDYDELLKTDLYSNKTLPQWQAFSLGSATSSYNLGYDLLEQAKYSEAEIEFRRALDESEKSEDLARVSACIHGLAYALGRQRKNREKIDLCLRQIKIEKRLKREKELKTAYRNIYFGYYWLARDLERERNFDEALHFYQKMRVAAGILKDERLIKEASRNSEDLKDYLRKKSLAGQNSTASEAPHRSQESSRHPVPE